MNPYLMLILGVFAGAIVAWLFRPMRDTERLDFLNATGCELVFRADRLLWGVVDPKGRTAAGSSAREAIDKAEAEGLGDE